ncbi:MAG: BolA family protein [Sphingomonadaceae bacterium]|nr:BolA family protein [Sphingomonadaceae bacterium]
MGPVAAELERRIRAAIMPEYLKIIDESALHRGHGGHNPEGESHFRVIVRASGLDTLPRVERTRAVLKAAGDLVTGGRVHALSVEVRAG